MARKRKRRTPSLPSAQALLAQMKARPIPYELLHGSRMARPLTGRWKQPVGESL